MTFDAQTLTDVIEGRYPVGTPTEWHRSVTGEPYVSVGSQADGKTSVPGTVDEGKAREVALDAETAYWSALSSFESYAEDRKGVLYWRVKPRLEWSDDKSRCMFYMRLLISDTPPEPKFAVCP